MELSSKKPITRRRPVVETSKREGRDPRFSDLAGEFSPESFASSYSFISKLQEEEVETLKKALKSAQTKPLDKDPTSQKTEQGEADAIRKALKRAESSVNHNRREERERRTLQAAKTKEMKERLRGKKNWWMKESDKKQLLLQSQFDSLAAEGGRKAVKLAIEKRRKKAMQKDRRSRPQMGEYKRSA
ncbi:rRNA biogenesis protein rrp36 [Tulasnella sp. 419]|nr:rRNA biogenesis protein rrp36 [Tulasnella sp. 419]